MEKQVTLKLAEIMEAAGQLYREDPAMIFAECVGVSFWQAFPPSEQSQLMQEVYCILCDMTFTPLECYQ